MKKTILHVSHHTTMPLERPFCLIVFIGWDINFGMSWKDTINIFFNRLLPMIEMISRKKEKDAFLRLVYCCCLKCLVLLCVVIGSNSPFGQKDNASLPMDEDEQKENVHEPLSLWWRLNMLMSKHHNKCKRYVKLHYSRACCVGSSKAQLFWRKDIKGKKKTIHLI